MSEEDEVKAGIILRASLACAAVRLRAYGATWEVVTEFLRPKLPPGMTCEQLKARALAHLECERTA